MIDDLHDSFGPIDSRDVVIARLSVENEELKQKLGRAINQLHLAHEASSKAAAAAQWREWP